MLLAAWLGLVPVLGRAVVWGESLGPCRHPIATPASLIGVLYCGCPPCTDADVNRDTRLSAADVVAVLRVGAAPTPTATAADFTPPASETASPTAPPTPAPSATSLPSPTPTPEGNQAPQIGVVPVYRTFPERPIALPIPVLDPEGDEFVFAALALPEGADLETNGLLRWTPATDQLGPFYVPFRVTDTGEPPASAEGQVAIKVSPDDGCAIPDCEPATGCTTTFPPLAAPCCDGRPVVRVAEPEAGCPEGAVLLFGRNGTGFGQLYNCDQIRLLANQQTDVTIRINVRTRCLPISENLTMHVRLESPLGVHHDRSQRLITQPRLEAPGYGQRNRVELEVLDAVPELEGLEAELRVTVTHGPSGMSVAESLRLILTHGFLDDLPET
jgi:hypothetical protein